MTTPLLGSMHHVELWVPDIDRATAQWGWLFDRLGYQPFQDWPGGRSWKLADTYIVVEQSADLVGPEHDRHRPGLNHLAFHAGKRGRVDDLVAEAADHGWTLLFPEDHPHAGGPHSEHGGAMLWQTYAAYLANTDGYEVELIAHT